MGMPYSELWRESCAMNAKQNLTLKRLGIDTHHEAVIYLRPDCEVCRSEGFEVFSRVNVQLGERSLIATIHAIQSDLLHHNEASLSEHAWQVLGAHDGAQIHLSHPMPLLSMDDIRAKIEGATLKRPQIDRIIQDTISGRLSEVHIAAFLAACANGRMDLDEIEALTQAMVHHGNRLHWHHGSDMIVDKHCVGGLPGNRTTPIVVAIVAAFGLTMPKTSSRAITSPAGTADTMEVLAPVNLDLNKIREVVEKENGCVVWGGAVDLSPSDDVLIRVERALALDSEGQLIASVLSKKIAAGSTHVVVDIPVGPNAKIRDSAMAERLKQHLEHVGKKVGLTLKVLVSDGTQPVGRGVGPALEARDVLQVLQNSENAPQDLKQRALELAGLVLEFSPRIAQGDGFREAKSILESGRAWAKFQAICEAQGGMRHIPLSSERHQVTAENEGKVDSINTFYVAKLAKLAGAPRAKAAGVDLHVKLGDLVKKGQPLYTIHAETSGQLEYALQFVAHPENHLIGIVK